MDSDTGSEFRLGELRAQLTAAGAILGVPIVVTDDDGWEISAGALRVGLGWYAARGHGDTEAVALALLHLWEGPRSARLEPARARRRSSIGAQRPAAVPLLDTVLRLQATAELRQGMPGLRAPLDAAITRVIPADVSVFPRHVQFVAAVLLWGTAGGADPRLGALIGALDKSVRSELERLAGLGSGATDVLRRITAPDPNRPALLRFERALALLLPPYERLLALDVADRGLDREGGDAPALADAGAGVETGAGAASDEPDGMAAEDPAHSDADPGDIAAAAEEHARPGNGKDDAEGADLFAAEHAGAVETMLSTPMPTSGALFDAIQELSVDPAGVDPEGRRDLGTAGAGGPVAIGLTALTEYRARAAALSPAIERMRELWARVITDRVALRPGLSRRPQAEGEELAIDALPAAVAQALAGVARPQAYRSRVSRPRRTRRTGSTDYVFLVDRSASMQGPIAAAASDAMLIMLEALSAVERDVRHAERAAGSSIELDVRTSLLVFDAEVTVVKALSSGLDDAVRREIDAAIRSPRGSTNDGAALRSAAEQLGISPAGHAVEGAAHDGLERKRMVVLISDGGSNDAVAAARELRALRAAGVQVIGCGFGSDEMTDRYAPEGRRVNRPDELAETLHELIAGELG
ncbi:von Willebrand factor type A domain-containing protein [Leucobacter luti]|uniref:von Willebrand factor type A domain-containing protein n=1 Tax=Leucobacter luti TaxID=340320 RepID=A0A4R6RV57_9MICO|nr:VWA domain-containing protein [Leucobacter luti]TDP90185.1 von Willebrand factor type A domain-containing protein [Leucobacter luti]